MRLQDPGLQERRSFWHGLLRGILRIPYAAGLLVITGATSLLWLLASLCHLVGLTLIWPPKTLAKSVRILWQWFLSDVGNTVGTAPRRLMVLQSRQFSAGLVLFAGIAVFSFGVLRVGNLFAEGFDLKGRILGEATSAVKLLEQGKAKIGEDNVEGAGQRFGFALENFRAGQQAIDNSNVLVKALTAALPQGKDAQNLLKAGEAGSQAAVEFANLSTALKSFTFDGTGFYSTDSATTLTDIQQRFQAAKRKTAEAGELIRKVPADRVPAEYQERFAELRAQLQGLETALDVLDKAFAIAVQLSTGHKHVLVLLQNSNELRPTGGFPGTFGAFDLKDGRVQKQTISSIYDLDGQLDTKYIPPLPLFAVNNRWYLRDSNWFASFPESAETMMGFYEAEAHHTPDIVIAITPQVATRLLELTGPIIIPGYETPLDADNFVEVTQVETSIYYDRTENKPKKMLAEFFPIFLSRVAGVVKEKPVEFVDAVRKSFAAKDIIAYSRSSDLQERITELSWDGGVASTSRDYLSIVSANLGGTKTDLAMKHDVSLESAVQADGSIINTLHIMRANPLPRVKGLENKSFVRVFVPEGSKLVSSKGFSYMDLDVKYGEQGETHPAVGAWEQNAVKEVGSGMLVGEEAGKTFFGNWVNLEGGQRAGLELVYRLPWKVDALDRHSLTVQKQPGANPYTVEYSLDLGGRHLLWATEETAAGPRVSKELEIDRDRFFGVVLGAEE
jgi:hypothetical protein